MSIFIQIYKLIALKGKKIIAITNKTILYKKIAIATGIAAEGPNVQFLKVSELKSASITRLKRHAMAKNGKKIYIFFKLLYL